MTKQLSVLAGLAILVVVLNHAAGYGQIALFLWADRYLGVTVPNWDALNSLEHYVLMVIRSLGIFTVPAFLFVSGFFSAYIGRGRRSVALQWKPAIKRIVSLAIPYLFWSLIIFAGDALQGDIYKPWDYVVKLLTTGALGHLYYVPLLCSFYLLSPWIVAAARVRPGWLIGISGLVQGGALVVRYIARFGDQTPILRWMIRITPDWSPQRWILFFVLGTVSAFNVQKVKTFFTSRKRLFLTLTLVCWMMNVIEGDVNLRRFQTEWLAGISTVSFHLFALSAIACFLAFSDQSIPGTNMLRELSKRSYGIYLVHLFLIDLTARLIREIAPWMLAYLVVFVPLLFAIGLGVPLLVMAGFHELSATRKVYRYLFG